jgi:predicted metal-dependent HD superfamily phosphohydrolase
MKTSMADPERWRQTWALLGVRVPGEALLRELIARYAEPHRKYHTLRHLEECFEKLAEIGGEAAHPGEVELALWFHDAIYDVKRHDNEEKSAAWARAEVLAAGLPATAADRVHALVMATRHEAVPGDIDQKVLVDVDLSILAAEPARFDEYEKQIREEYAWVPGIVFRARRRSILAEFLARPAIFSMRKFIDAYEARARANLERSIRKLGGGPR